MYFNPSENLIGDWPAFFAMAVLWFGGWGLIKWREHRYWARRQAENLERAQQVESERGGALARPSA